MFDNGSVCNPEVLDITELTLLVPSREKVSSGTVENSIRPLPSWKREVIEHIGTPPLLKIETDYFSLDGPTLGHSQTRESLATSFPKDQSV